MVPDLGNWDQGHTISRSDSHTFENLLLLYSMAVKEIEGLPVVT